MTKSTRCFGAELRYLKILASVMDCSEAIADLHILCLVQYESSPSVT
ncbi:hypothetical protein BVRB_6g152460 [Beta vulgaris subsp. vulgaris]|nr:hypothetical protein BVRB_6g152460 [Beta vulgaris subsp. vulgaris]